MSSSEDGKKSGGSYSGTSPFTTAVDVALGRRLRELREAMGLAQQEVAAALDLSGQTWKRHEDGVRIPASRLWWFCCRFGFKIHDVFDELPITTSLSTKAWNEPYPSKDYVHGQLSDRTEGFAGRKGKLRVTDDAPVKTPAEQEPAVVPEPLATGRRSVRKPPRSRRRPPAKD